MDRFTLLLLLLEFIDSKCTFQCFLHYKCSGMAACLIFIVELRQSLIIVKMKVCFILEQELYSLIIFSVLVVRRLIIKLWLIWDFLILFDYFLLSLVQVCDWTLLLSFVGIFYNAPFETDLESRRSEFIYIYKLFIVSRRESHLISRVAFIEEICFSC